MPAVAFSSAMAFFVDAANLPSIRNNMARTLRKVSGCLVRGLAILLFAHCLWGASGCSNTSFSNTNITCVQSSNQIVENNTVTLDGFNLSFGDAIIMMCRASNATTSFSPLASGDNSAIGGWQALTPLTSWDTSGSPSLKEQVWWIQEATFMPTSQHFKVTCTANGGTGASAAAWQFHSPTGLIHVDVQSTLTAHDNVSGSQSISISPTQANDLLLAFVDQSGNTLTAGSGFTALDSGAGIVAIGEGRGLAASGATTATYSLSSSVSTVGFAIALEQGAYPSVPFISRPQATDCLNAFPCAIQPTGAGHFLVVGVVSGVTNPPPFWVSGGCASSWQTDTDNSSVTLAIFHCSSALGGVTSINIGPSADIFDASVFEYSVTPGYSIQPDPGANAVGTTIFSGSTYNPQTAQVTTTGADDVVVGVVEAENDINNVMPTPNGWTNPILCGCGGAVVNDALNVTAGFNRVATLVITGNQGPGIYSSASVAYEAVANNQGTLPSAPTSLSVGSVGGGMHACDVDNSGSVTVQDVQLAVNMDLNLSPCTLNINGSGTCNVVTVQRIINADLGMPCVTGPGVTTNSVSMSWAASISPNIAGYNVYRGAAAAGPFSKVNSTLIVGTSYTDTTVQAGQTYYYVVTAVDSGNNESPYSSPAAQSVVPSS